MEKSVLENLENKPNKYYKIYLFSIFLILVLPLINAHPLLSPPAWGKTILFRIIFSFLIFLIIKQIVFEQAKLNLGAIFKNPGLLLCSGLILFFILSTIFSQNPVFSFWGSPLRGGGSLNFILYVAFGIFCFFILEKKDWKKVINLNLLIGALISVTAVMQKLSLFKNVINPRAERVVSTLGSSILLALYLLLLIFFALSFAVKSGGKKRVFYLFLVFLFCFAMFLSGSRAGFLGLAIGLSFFLLFYPQKNKKIKWCKIAFLVLIFLMISSVFWLGKNPGLVDFLSKNQVTKIYFSRAWNTAYPLLTQGKLTVMQDRVSVWKIGALAIKDKPLLGYGPENFSIPFDKYFHPALPGMDPSILQWWDRAHNFIFDIGSTAGLPALIIYISLFAFVFYKLQKKKKESEDSILIHGIQATFIAYFTANFFNFDCFSTYLLSFLILGLSFSLIFNKNKFLKFLKPGKEISPFKCIAVILILFAFVLFWHYGNIKPLVLNRDANSAKSLAKSNKCQLAIEKMDYAASSKTVISNYLKLMYIDIINQCISQNPSQRLQLVQKGIEVLKQSSELRPEYTRTWWTLNIFYNYLISRGINSEQIKKEAVFFCEKSLELSPNHIKTINSCAETYMLLGDYEKAIEKSHQCINLVPQSNRNNICWFQMAKANISLGNIEKGEECLRIARDEKEYSVSMKTNISLYYQLIGAYRNAQLKIQDSSIEQKINDLYEELILIFKEQPDTAQKHVSLANTYKQIKEYEKAKEHALIAQKINPGLKEKVKNFLKTLE